MIQETYLIQKETTGTFMSTCMIYSQSNTAHSGSSAQYIVCAHFSFKADTLHVMIERDGIALTL
jgi:hypothetical protein